MSVAPQIRAPELAALARRLERVQSETPSRRVMTQIGADLVRSTKRRIASEKRAPDGTPWVAWSDDYEARKAPGTMLMQSRALHRSINAVVGDDQIEVGSDDIKAGVHNFGHTIRGGAFAGVHIPARPFIGLSDDDEARIQDRVVDDVRRRLGVA